MSEDAVLTVLVENVEGMQCLGQIAGTHLDPRCLDQNIIAAAYGVKSSGKTTFWHSMNKTILNNKIAGKVDFSWRDSGFLTYPSQKAGSTFSQCDDMALNTINMVEGTSYFRMVEHPSFPTLEKADVCAVVSWPAHPERINCGRETTYNKFYLDMMRYEIERCLESHTLSNAPVAKVPENIRAASKDVCDRVECRCVRMFSTSSNPLIEDAIEKIIKAARKVQQLQVMSPEP